MLTGLHRLAAAVHPYAGVNVTCPANRWLLSISMLSMVASAHADEATFNLCMARANAIRTTAEVRDNGVSRRDYEIGYAKMAGRSLNAAENEVVILAYGAPNYSPSELYRIAVNGCQRFLR